MMFIRRVLPGGLLLAAAISMGQSSPRLPYAEATAVAIAEPVRAGTTVKAVLPWLWPLLVTLALITYVPQLVLWLPNLIYGAK